MTHKLSGYNSYSHFVLMIAVTKIVNKLLKNIFFALTNLTSSNYLDTTKYKLQSFKRGHIATSK